MNISQIEENVKSLVKKIDKESFIYDMLLAYGTPKNTITRVKKGSRNLSKNENEVVIKKKIFFAYFDKDVDKEFVRLSQDSSRQKHDPRFLIVTDFKTIKALDTKLDEKIEFALKEFNKKFDFFLPLAGIERKEFKHENPVDVKAAEKLAKLFDLIKKDNPKSDPKSLHSLNVFLTRLLFCYFAEDTDIFPQGLFTDSVGSHTQVDGSDLSEYLAKVFEIMNLEKRPKNTPDYLNNFPYVNGGLFAENHPIPKFSKKSRESLLDIGDLNWAEINPDIFGSMIQAVVHPDQRAGLGMHYTSVSNIMKVIEPLFLNELYDAFKKAGDSKPKLRKLLERISTIKVFDPACGSGNFLIISYKELRTLEMKVLKKLNEFQMSGVTLSNFYGIELDDFAHEVAILSLWLSEHQMNALFHREFGTVKATLPLKESGRVVCNNAALVDWSEVCKPTGEIYILGNPPYLGSSLQSKEQKKDLEKACDGFKNYKNLDYIAIWFIKASNFIKGNQKAKFSFVSTNSISQGEQVSLLWPEVFKLGLEIDFCHLSFKWTNNAKNKAAVFCVIIGLRNVNKKEKFIYTLDKRIKVKNISPYLIPGENIVVTRVGKPLSKVPKMLRGSTPTDDGNFILNKKEKDELVTKYPASKKYVKDFVGTSEFLKGTKRWCLWIDDNELANAKKIDPINKRLSKISEFRKKSKAPCTVEYAKYPNRFKQIQHVNADVIIIPRHVSERRHYITAGFFPKGSILSDTAQGIYGGGLLIFALISSKIHMDWVKLIGGRLKTDVRYSSALCYNTFPFPELSDQQIKRIEKLAMEILKIREKHSEKLITELYNPESMPKELIQAHEVLDSYIETCLKKGGFNSESEKFEYLLKKYKELMDGQ